MNTEEINELRNRLNSLIESGEDLCSEYIIKLSQELDELISEFVRQNE